MLHQHHHRQGERDPRQVRVDHQRQRALAVQPAGEEDGRHDGDGDAACLQEGKVLLGDAVLLQLQAGEGGHAEGQLAREQHDDQLAYRHDVQDLPQVAVRVGHVLDVVVDLLVLEGPDQQREADEQEAARLAPLVQRAHLVLLQRQEPRERQEEAERLPRRVAQRRVPDVLLRQHRQRPPVHRHVLRRAQEVQRREDARQRPDGLLLDQLVDGRRNQRGADQQLQRHHPRLPTTHAAHEAGVHHRRPQQLHGEGEAGRGQRPDVAQRHVLLLQDERGRGGQAHGQSLQEVQDQQDGHVAVVALELLPHRRLRHLCAGQRHVAEHRALLRVSGLHGRAAGAAVGEGGRSAVGSGGGGGRAGLGRGGGDPLTLDGLAAGAERVSAAGLIVEHQAGKKVDNERTRSLLFSFVLSPLPPCFLILCV
eukprot:Rhum_TRINITY_DN128_c0_g1::Rhum_TRINITY_DN128_c0_g1_i1::g.399::m.399